MAGSRAYRIGTVFSRAEALIKRKAVKEENAPLWLEVYEKFPPKFEPSYGRPAPQIELKQIFYEEDILRAKIHEKYPKNYGEIDLKGKGRTKVQMCIEEWRLHVSEGMPSEEAMDKAMKKIYERRGGEAKSLDSKSSIKPLDDSSFKDR